jgi:hypothetical protein
MSTVTWEDRHQLGFHVGIAHHSRFEAFPILHIIEPAGNGWTLWCSGGVALRENTASHRRCCRCLTLLRKTFAEQL